MITRERFVNKLRELNFTFIRQADKVELWRQKGTALRVTVPRRDLIPEAHVHGQLRMCGVSEPEILSFLRDARS